MLEDVETHSFRAMGCQMQVWCQAPQVDLQTVEQQFHQAERKLSRFDSDSELSQFNRSAGEWIKVSPLLWMMIDQALRLAEMTHGLFNPAILPMLEAAGYQRPFVPNMSSPASDTPVVPIALANLHLIDRQVEQRRVRLPAGMRLDFGGIAKGVVAQTAVSWLSQFGPCLVDAGGDLVAGGAPVGWPGWPVEMAVPIGGEKRGLTGTRVWLANNTLATSGVDFRRWQQNGRWQHHLIDPRTGQPAQTDLLAVSLLMADAAEAEVWTTTAMILGSDQARQLLENGRIPALLITDQFVPIMTTALHSLYQSAPRDLREI